MNKDFNSRKMHLLSHWACLFIIFLVSNVMYVLLVIYGISIDIDKAIFIALLCFNFGLYNICAFLFGMEMLTIGSGEEQTPERKLYGVASAVLAIFLSFIIPLKI